MRKAKAKKKGIRDAPFHKDELRERKGNYERERATCFKASYERSTAPKDQSKASEASKARTTSNKE